MSRKNRELAASTDEVTSPKIWVSNLGYSAFKPDNKTGRIREPVVVLFHKAHLSQEKDKELHPCVVLGKVLQNVEKMAFSTMIAIDIGALIPEDKLTEVLDEEGASVNLEKKLSKPVCRIIEKMFLSASTVVAYGSCCQLLLKLIPLSVSSSELGHKLTADNVKRLVFINPQLPPRCINSQFRGAASLFCKTVPTDILFLSEADRGRRDPVLRSWFPIGTTSICDSTRRSFIDSVVRVLQTIDSGVESSVTATAAAAVASSERGILRDYDPCYATELGESIWMAELVIQMNAYTKQYEQKTTVLTWALNEEIELVIQRQKGIGAKAGDIEIDEGSALPEGGGGGEEFGGLIFRGNRCVLVRSLQGSWKGMRIPSVAARSGEDPCNAAVRSVLELCDIDDDEVYPLVDIPPVKIYHTSGSAKFGYGGDVTVYALYAVNGPPDGPLEDADCEDEEDRYDWYTYPRAVEALGRTANHATIAALHTMAAALSAAASANRIPRKWGGVFGQEVMSLLTTSSSSTAAAASATAVPSVATSSKTKSYGRATAWTKKRAVGSVAGASGGIKAAAPISSRGSGSGSVREQQQQEGEEEEEEEEEDTPSPSRGSGLLGRSSSSSYSRLQTTSETPCLIIAGGFGAGKTTVLQHILRLQKSCSKIAVFSNSLSSVNIDAAALQQTSSSSTSSGDGDDGEDSCGMAEVTVVEVNEGCVCCDKMSSFEQSISELFNSASALEEPYDYVIIEAVGCADPTALARMIIAGSAGDLKLHIDCIVTVIDSLTARYNLTKGSIALYRQLIAADVIILNRCSELLAVSGVTEQELDSMRSELCRLNPAATIMPSMGGEVDVAQVLYTGRFSQMRLDALPESGLSRSPTVSGLSRSPSSPNPNPTNTDSSSSSSTNSNDSNTHGAAFASHVFRSRRPFHPKRFEAFIARLQAAAISRLSGSATTTTAGETAAAVTANADTDNIGDNLVGGDPCASILRVKGFVWLANYPDNQGSVSYVRGYHKSFQLKLGSQWWASLSKASWPAGLQEAIKPLWSEPYGDRQNELVIVYENSDANGLIDEDAKGLKEYIDGALAESTLTYSEFEEGQERWNHYEDFEINIFD